MKTSEAAGPDLDVAFFNELRTVFEKYPDAARKYSIRWQHNEISNLKIDFDKQHGVSHVDGNRIVTEFQDISDVIKAGSHHKCCEWYKSGGRWKCAVECLE